MGSTEVETEPRSSSGGRCRRRSRKSHTVAPKLVPGTDGKILISPTGDG